VDGVCRRGYCRGGFVVGGFVVESVLATSLQQFLITRRLPVGRRCHAEGAATLAFHDSDERASQQATSKLFGFNQITGRKLTRGRRRARDSATRSPW